MLNWFLQSGFIISVLCTRVLCEDVSQGPHQPKIIGGNVSEQSYKYMISLQLQVDERTLAGNRTGRKIWRHSCGAAIVNEKCIVTAAHCVDRMPKARLSIVAGTNNLTDNSGERYYLDEYTVHEEYSPFMRSDIAILRLNDSMKFTDKIGPLTVTNKFVGGDVDLLLTGWGFTNATRSGGSSVQLQEIRMTSMTPKQCSDQKSPAGKTEICTYGRPLKGSCGGDSGGPLVRVDGENVELVGVVSFGTNICATGRPDIFTRASVFYDWINVECAR